MEIPRFQTFLLSMYYLSLYAYCSYFYQIFIKIITKGLMGFLEVRTAL